MYVIDLNDEKYPIQTTTTNDYELNGNRSLSFRIQPNKANNTFINDITELWTVVDHDDVPHKIVYLKKRGEGESLSVEVTAVPLFYDDMDRRRIYERYDRHMTAAFCFGLIFEGSGYNYVLTGSFDAQDWEGFGEGDTRLALFKKALERYKAEFRIVGNTVYIENMVGRDTQFQYRYRLNASNIVMENDATAYYTYARGYGDYGDGEGGEDWRDAKLIREYTSPIAEIIGIREAPPIKDGRITDIETMDSLLKTLVDESLKISVTATIHDLRAQGYSLAQPEIGDRVFLIDERIGLKAEVRIVGMQIIRNWKGEVKDLKITFGTPGLVRRHQSRIESGVRRIEDIFAGRERLPYNVLPEAIRRASEALLGAMTELEITELGIIARDVTNPNNLVIYNSAGLGVSRDGGQTFENAITYLGVNTNLLTAGDIHTNNIRIIGDTYFYWDGTGLYAIDPIDVGKYVRLTSDGLYIAKGAMTIERPDGARFINNGTPNLNYNVQGSSPPFTSALVRVTNQWYITEATTDQSVDMFSFRHEGRFLKVSVAHRMETEGTASGAVTVRGLASWSNIINSYIVFSNSVEDGSEYHTFTIDIGVPTYQAVNFYVMLRTGAANRRAMTRVLRCWQEG